MSKETRLQAKTFPYGTVREVIVLNVFWHPQTGLTVMAGDKNGEAKEAYVMLGHPPTNARKGDEGIVTFTPGGEMGGHWLYSPKTSIVSGI